MAELALNNNHSLTQGHVRAVSYVLKGLYFLEIYDIAVERFSLFLMVLTK